MKRRRVVVPAALWSAGALGVWLLIARKDAVRAALVQQLLEKPARRSFTDLSQQLEHSGTRLESRLNRVSDTPRNREIARHIIGIERWGQQRLRVMRGDVTFIKDGHRPYRPSEAPLSLLRENLSRTRAQTVELSRSLVGQPLPRHEVEHNHWGPLSARAWLYYLRLHAELESLKLR